MKLTRRDILGVVALSAAGGCSGPARPIRVSVPIAPTVAPFYVALERGFFEQEGLQLETEEVQMAANQAQLLAAGRIDASFMTLTPALLSAVHRGADTRVVCGRDVVSDRCVTTGEIIGRTASFPGRLQDPRELRGKKIAFTAAGSFSEFALDTILDTAGLDRTHVEGVALRQAESLAAVAAGQIDGVVAVGPLQGVRVAEGLAVYPGLSRARPGLMATYAVFGQRLRGQDRAAGVRFLRAYLRGLKAFVAGDTPEALDMLARKSGLDAQSLRSACRDYSVIDGRIDAGSIEAFGQWALRKKYVDVVPPAAALMDASLIGEALA